MTPGDLGLFAFLARPTLDPQGERLLYLETRVQGEEYETSLKVVGLGAVGLEWALEGFDASNPLWDAEGRRILFTSKTGEGAQSGFYTVEPGGEAELKAVFNGGVQSLQWDSGGGKAYFLSRGPKPQGDVHLIEDIPFWFNGEGWVYSAPRALSMVDLETGEAWGLTPQGSPIQAFSLDAEGGRLAYAESVNPLRPGESRIRVVKLGGLEVEASLEGYSVQSLHWGPEGVLAFTGHDGSRGYSTHHRVYLWRPGEGEVRDLSGSTGLGVARRHYYDLRSPKAGDCTPVWSGESLYFALSKGGERHIYKAPAHGELEQVTEGPYCVEEFHVAGKRLALTRVSSDTPVELWVFDGEWVKVAESLLDPSVSLVKAERFTYGCSDGAKAEGWLLRPLNQRPGAGTPAVVDIHGGPKSKFGWSFMYEHQLYAAHGYAVIYINIRGSDGYDQEFGDIRGHWGERDFQDLMEGVDAVLAENPWIDGGRLGVTGLSFGGYMTNWVVTHTDRFKAAVSQNGISSLESFYGSSDIGFHFAPEQIGGTPWENPEDYREKSPLTHVANVNTPVLFVHSWEDYRCWVDQSFHMYTALKALGKEAKLALFMEGAHTFRTTGKPSHRVRRLEVMLDWFNQHLKPVQTP